MRLHDRLAVSLMLRFLLLAVVALSVVFVLVDLFEQIDKFVDNRAPWPTVARFYLYKLPEIVRLTLPVDVLLAVIFALGVMSKNNEIVALLASGVGMLRIALPLLVVAAITVVLSTVLAEKIVPESNSRMLRVERVDIQKRPPLDAPVRHDFSYRGDNGYHYFVRLLDLQAARMTGVTVHQYRDGRVIARLDARSAEWHDGFWEFRDGFYRTFAGERPAAGAGDTLLQRPAGERAAEFRVLRLPDLRESPQDLARLEPEPEAMDYGELRRHVEKLQASGEGVNDLLVDLHSKISYPLTNLILAVLGVGLSARKKRASLAAGFGLTLVICFAYLAISQIGAALGKNEVLPPLLAAWIGQLLFAAAGGLLVARANR